MRHPIRHLVDHLLFTAAGQVWAIWQVEAPPYRHTSRSHQREVLDRTEALLRGLRGEALLLSTCRRVDPGEVAAAMTEGIDLDTHPGWEDACDAWTAEVEAYPLTERAYWLALPLEQPSWRDLLRAGPRALAAELAGQFGVTPPPPAEADVAAYRRRADQLAAALPGLSLRPATPGEVLWLYQRAPRRGLAAEPTPGPDQAGAGHFDTLGTLRGPSLAGLDELCFREGAPTTNHRGSVGRGDTGVGVGWSPSRHRMLTITSPAPTTATVTNADANRGPGPVPSADADAETSVAAGVGVTAGVGDAAGVDSEDRVSYQAFLALAEMPTAFRWPGSEYLARLDDLEFAVDWAIRVTAVPREAVEAATRRRATQLAEQVGQQDNDRTGLPSELEAAIADFDDYRSRLASSSAEVELQTHTVLAVAADTPGECHRRAEVLRAEFAPHDYQLVRPTGGQLDGYRAMLPGYPLPRTLADYRQYLLARDAAMAIPIQSTGLGDPTGGLLGIRASAGGAAPVLLSPTYGPRRLNTSASTAVVGELGAGKSVCLKLILDQIVRRGRLGLVIDRTPSGEWPRFAASLPGRVSTVTIGPDARTSLDPLRLFAPQAAQRHTEGFLSLLLGVEPLSSEGAVLSDAIGTVLKQPAPSMRGLLDHLRATGHPQQTHQNPTSAGDPVAADLARRLAALARYDLAAVVLDPDLPILTTTTGGPDETPATGEVLVAATHQIALPSREELSSELATKQLAPEKRLGRAVMYLVAALCRDTAFTAGRFAGVFLDEAYWLTNSSEGERLALELVRDGRKHDAAVFFGAHHPDDIGSATISGLLGQKAVFRHRDSRLAADSLAWLGLDPDPAMVDLVARGLSPVDLPTDAAAERAGECLWRDARGRIAPMRVTIPNLPDLAAAITTTPEAETTTNSSGYDAASETGGVPGVGVAA